MEKALRRQEKGKAISRIELRHRAAEGGGCHVRNLFTIAPTRMGVFEAEGNSESPATLRVVSSLPRMSG